MRVLIVTTQDVFFLSHIKERALYFKDRGCVVAVAAEKTSEKLVDRIKELGFSFYDTKIKRKSINPLSELVALYRLFSIQREFKPDLSYHLGAKAIFYGTFTARLCNSRVAILNAPIGLGYVFASKTLKARLLRPLVFMLYRIFLNPFKSRVIIENWDDINFFVDKGCLNPKDAFCILWAGVDTKHFSPGIDSEKNQTCTVLMASRLIKEKGVEDFVAVAESLYREKVNVKMILAGEPDFGNPSSISRQDFEKIKRNPSLQCLGHVEDMAKVMRKVHICCLPSYYREGLPRVLVEAASSGLVILTTDTVGCKETVRNDNGFLFPPHDRQQLIKLIKYLVDHPDETEFMGKNSRVVALHFFDTQLVCKRTFDLASGLVCEIFKK